MSDGSSINGQVEAEFSSREFQRLRRNLRCWYARHGRELPWRSTRDPYRIWISEIMLQQTTVAAVIPYFERFLDRFPDVKSLAAADEQDVLQLWEGLGYYSRARNLHKAAKVLCDEHDAEFPATADELQSLPGIGRYTAGAIASFAFDRKAPIVEANTLRLYARLLGLIDDPRTASSQRTLWQFAADVLPRTNPGTFNQALMELGAKVCTPREPACSTCPIRNQCRAFRDGSQAVIPVRPQRQQITDVTEASLAIQNGDAYLLRRRGDGERWAGLWDFPRFELSESTEDSVDNATRRWLTEQTRLLTGIQAEVGDAITTIHHSVTRYRIRLLCFVGSYKEGKPSSESVRWVNPTDFGDYPLSVTGRQFAETLATLHS